MQSSHKTAKIERTRPLKSQWASSNSSVKHTGKPDHRFHIKDKRKIDEAEYA